MNKLFFLVVFIPGSAYCMHSYDVPSLDLSAISNARKSDTPSSDIQIDKVINIVEEKKSQLEAEQEKPLGIRRTRECVNFRALLKRSLAEELKRKQQS